MNLFLFKEEFMVIVFLPDSEKQKHLEGEVCPSQTSQEL